MAIRKHQQNNKLSGFYFCRIAKSARLHRKDKSGALIALVMARPGNDCRDNPLFGL
jgi:hypothetical protein